MPEERRYKAYIPAFDTWIEHGDGEYTPPQYTLTTWPTSEECKAQWDWICENECKEDWEYGCYVEFVWKPRGYISVHGNNWCRSTKRNRPVSI
jgi:hypothetical protein